MQVDRPKKLQRVTTVPLTPRLLKAHVCGVELASFSCQQLTLWERCRFLGFIEGSDSTALNPKQNLQRCLGQAVVEALRREGPLLHGRIYGLGFRGAAPAQKEGFKRV